MGARRKPRALQPECSGGRAPAPCFPPLDLGNLTFVRASARVLVHLFCLEVFPHLFLFLFSVNACVRETCLYYFDFELCARVSFLLLGRAAAVARRQPNRRGRVLRSRHLFFQRTPELRSGGVGALIQIGGV